MVSILIVIIGNSILKPIILNKYILSFNKKIKNVNINSFCHVLPLIHTDLSKLRGCCDFAELFELGSEDS